MGGCSWEKGGEGWGGRVRDLGGCRRNEGGRRESIKETTLVTDVRRSTTSANDGTVSTAELRSSNSSEARRTRWKNRLALWVHHPHGQSQTPPIPELKTQSNGSPGEHLKRVLLAFTIYFYTDAS
ncbi:uncharacterized protein [Fopius arisanus]|uniref:Uncharacterized protein n=1 Tax=Fopius arisanus TaxID=64838 RepID=A0A9R1TIG6_9HYME|nr:PREDICTED: uncharacterized protein LOC105270614 [Fopius arisanus]